MRVSLKSGVVLGALTAVVAGPVFAQSASGSLRSAQAQSADLFARDRSVAVRERSRPEYEALGVRAGTFMVYPKIEWSAENNDNVFAVATGEESDVILRVRPDVAVESTWSRHAVAAYARASLDRYQDFDSEDSETWGVGASGRLDIVRGSAVNFGADFASLVEPRTSSNTPGFAAEPVSYDVSQAFLAASRTMGRVRLSGRGDVRTFDYDDVLSTTGTVIDQDDRDREIRSLTGRVDVALSPATALFVQVTGNDRDYDAASTPVFAARDSSGYEALAGVNFELGAVARGEIAAGYISQDYDDARFDDIDGFGARAQVEWFPTELTTFTATGSRTIEDAGIAGSNGYLSSSVGLRVDHELLRNLILTASVSRAVDEYEGIDREDTRMDASVSGTWLVNRNFGVNLAASRFEQESDGVAGGPDFTVNRLIASLVTQF
jgi:hypothetical protein